MTFPRMFRVRQHYEAPRVENIREEVHAQLAKLNLREKIKPGQTVAITAGSRGIANIALIIKSVVEHFRELGAEPFIVPAMGSHGGGTAMGQIEILHGYNITPEYTGAEIRSSMETIIVEQTPQGIPVHFDKLASQADHVMVVGRIKPHTNFVGEIESGLHKMMLIGLGKHEGAKIYHRAIQNYSFLEIIRAVADVVLRRCKIIGGLGIVENAYDETAMLDAVAPEDFFAREKELLVLAKQWMPRLPFPEVDLLIVDEIGKNISGSGMDTNVIGRKYNDHVAMAGDSVRCTRIVVLGLTEETHGNACGIGMCEFTTDRAANAVNKEITRINCVTGGHPTAGAIPLAFATDRDAISAAIETLGLIPPEKTKAMHIANTLHLKELLISEAYLEDAKTASHLEILSEVADMPFDASGSLRPVFPQRH